MPFVFRFFSILPLWLLHALGAAMGWAAFLGSPVYRRRFLENAALAGYRDVRLLEVSETYASRPQYKGEMDAIAVSASRTTPIEPGVVGTSATLTVKYEMTR